MIDSVGVNASVIEAIYTELETVAVAEIGAEGFSAAEIVLEREIDIRYHHQAHELTVPPTWS